MGLRLLVIRHAETDWSRERRFAGSRDGALTERGRRQAEAVADALVALPLVAVYTSPLERARVTAEAIAKRHALEGRVDAAFRDMAFGAWEGLTRDEVAARDPEGMAHWRAAPHEVVPPGGEALSAVAVRVAEGLGRIREAHGAAETVALVTHAIVVRLLVLDALGLGPDRLWSVDATAAGITEIEYEPGWVTVHRMNTLAHLEAIEA